MPAASGHRPIGQRERRGVGVRERAGVQKMKEGEPAGVQGGIGVGRRLCQTLRDQWKDQEIKI